MINEFSHTKNGETIIYCLNKRSGIIKEISIDTNDFPRVSSLSGTWSLIHDKRRGFYRVVMYLDGKPICLKRFLKNLHNSTDGTSQQVTFISDDVYDYRQCNLYVCTLKELNTLETQQKLKKLAKEIPSINREPYSLNADNSEDLFTTQEISKKLNVQPWNIRKWAKVYNIIPHKNKAGHLLFSREQLTKFSELKSSSKRLKINDVHQNNHIHQNIKNDCTVLHDLQLDIVSLKDKETGFNYKFNSLEEYNALRSFFKKILL
ncbi:MerR family transcriptional regulator [Bacillus sp. SIMBA_031]|uniref:hypothetical protein n=1 Tax=Bacillus sp. SIMBA_031 TaxID=3085774 RepID=UPI003977F1B0